MWQWPTEKYLSVRVNNALARTPGERKRGRASFLSCPRFHVPKMYLSPFSQLIDNAYALRGVAIDQGDRYKYVIPMGTNIGYASPNKGGGLVQNVVIIVGKSPLQVFTSWCQ